MAHEQSTGVRSCLGRRCEELYFYSRVKPSQIFFRFSEIEAVVVITMLVLRYKIEVKEEPEFAGETFEERYTRITACDQRSTTT